MHDPLVITNARLSSESHDRWTVLCSRGRIDDIRPGPGNHPPSGTAIDAAERLLSSGLIDVHIQGAGGADVLDGSVDALGTISRTCAQFGVTSFLGTTVFRPGGDNRHLETAAQACGRDLGGARMIGIHLEGPFISCEKRGMIQAGCVSEISPGMLDAVLRLTGDTLKIMTVAPELNGGLEVIRILAEKGVVASIGHTAASYAQARAGIKAGITQATHLFNAMQLIHHRSPGPVPAVLEEPGVYVQIIPDHVHVHPAVLRMVWPALGPGRVIAITDGIRALGLPDGSYEYNGVEFESREGAARYHDGTLIGTALGLNRLVLKLAEATGCSLDDALRTATKTPARSLGIDGQKGTLAPGMDADLAIFNSDLSVWKTLVAGRVVYGGPA